MRLLGCFFSALPFVGMCSKCKVIQALCSATYSMLLTEELTMSARVRLCHSLLFYSYSCRDEMRMRHGRSVRVPEMANAMPVIE